MSSSAALLALPWPAPSVAPAAACSALVLPGLPVVVAITGTKAVPHHTRWMQAMDDSLQEYLRETDGKQGEVKVLRG